MWAVLLNFSETLFLCGVYLYTLYTKECSMTDKAKRAITNYTSHSPVEYLRYDVVQPAKEPHIKSTGVRKNKNARENPTIYGR